MKRTHAPKFKPHKHRPRQFREGDRVTPLYYGEKSKAVGTFIMYCPGYLSHAMVRWDGSCINSRVRVEHLSLERQPDVGAIADRDKEGQI